MKITWLDRLAQFHNLLQCELFPLLESAVGPLDKQSKRLAAVVSLEPLARFVSARRAHTGRPLSDRLALATAFFAKAVYSLPTTRHLIQRLQTDTPLRRLCGWDSAAQVPTEATFSRATQPPSKRASICRATRTKRRVCQRPRKCPNPLANAAPKKDGTNAPRPVNAVRGCNASST